MGIGVYPAAAGIFAGSGGTAAPEPGELLKKLLYAGLLAMALCSYGGCVTNA